MCSVAQSCPTLFNSMNCSMPGCSVHGISQTRILEQVAISSSRGSSEPRDRTRVSCIAGEFFTAVPPRKPNLTVIDPQKFISTTGNKIQHNLKNTCTHNSKTYLQSRDLRVAIRKYSNLRLFCSCLLLLIFSFFF